jgi:hypothetical protein
VLCATGVVLASLLIAGVATLPVMFSLWVVYLSLVVGGQLFLSFQWDILLLETGFTALFFAPATLRPRLPWREPPVPRGGRWLLWLLLFKLMVLSGAVKLICLDETWWNLTALDYHYFTQPIPVWTSWYAHHLPAWFQKASILLMFIVEIAVPFVIFFSRRCRIVGFVALVFLQGMIAWTGNYGFFNLLTVVLCIPLLDDRFLARLVPGKLRRSLPVEVAQPDASRWFRPRRLARAAAAIFLVLFFVASSLTFVRELVRTRPREGIDGFVGAAFDTADRLLLSWGRPYVLRWVDPFRTVSGYGLFRAMTRERPEIVIEGSADGQTWVEYEFRWKAGDLSRSPQFAQPHMPRLDWQMWFAALNPQRASGWLQGLSYRLLQGSPDVLRLLGDNPFPDTPPLYLRWAYYDYRFTTPEERAESGEWWKREHRGLLVGPVSLSNFQRADGG